jgi:hypothetical protein
MPMPGCRAALCDESGKEEETAEENRQRPTQ